jgi:hypothetical protein
VNGEVNVRVCGERKNDGCVKEEKRSPQARGATAKQTRRKKKKRMGDQNVEEGRQTKRRVDKKRKGTSAML